MVSIARVLLLGLAVPALFLLLAPAAAASSPAAALDVGNAAEVLVTLRSDFDLLETGRSIPVEVEVTAPNGVPLPGVLVLLEASAGSVEPSSVWTDMAGKASFTFQGKIEETSWVLIGATVIGQGTVTYDELAVRVVRLPPPPIYARAEFISLGIASVILGFLATTEVGRYGLLTFLTFPLYIRLRKEEVLEHFVRGQIYGFIRTNPGAHYSRIRDALEVANGTLSHHLKTLEVQGFVAAKRDGMYKKFYPVDFEAEPGGKGIRLSDLQARLLRRLEENGQTRQADLARDLDVTQQTVSYNLRLMCKEGLLERERLGRRVQYRVAPM
ncbi:MAG: MarR family transcriptional regulator [Thermoplasmata archaeon]